MTIFQLFIRKNRTQTKREKNLNYGKTAKKQPLKYDKTPLKYTCIYIHTYICIDI